MKKNDVKNDSLKANNINVKIETFIVDKRLSVY